jgi:predicted negative regulator of RcsB-dependent stress response
MKTCLIFFYIIILLVSITYGYRLKQNRAIKTTKSNKFSKINSAVKRKLHKGKSAIHHIRERKISKNSRSFNPTCFFSALPCFPPKGYIYVKATRS